MLHPNQLGMAGSFANLDPFELEAAGCAFSGSVDEAALLAGADAGGAAGGALPLGAAGAAGGEPRPAGAPGSAAGGARDEAAAYVPPACTRYEGARGS